MSLSHRTTELLEQIATDIAASKEYLRQINERSKATTTIASVSPSVSPSTSPSVSPSISPSVSPSS